MSPVEVAAILFGVFAVLVILRVPVAFALGLACVPVFFIDDRLTPFLLLNEMLKSYNSFLLLAIPFFMLAANLMNAAGITDKLINLSRALVGWLPGGLGHVSVVVSMLFAGISGSSTAEAAGVGGVLIPAMKKQGYDTVRGFADRLRGGDGRDHPAEHPDGRVGRRDLGLDRRAVPRRRRAGRC